MTPRISALLCELEGVIAHTLPLRASALIHALATRGIHIPSEAAVHAVAGRTPADSLARLGPAVAVLDDTDRIIVAMAAEQRFSKLLGGGLVLASNAAEFVQAAHSHLPLAIVTRARRSDADLILDLSGLRDAFAFVICAEDAPVAKPDPWGYDAAAARLRKRGGAPDSFVALEDGAAGIESAHGAGILCIAVGPLPDDEAFRADAWVPSLADQSVRSLGELLHGQTRRVQ